MIHNSSGPLSWSRTFPGPFHDSQHFRPLSRFATFPGPFHDSQHFRGPSHDPEHLRGPFIMRNISGLLSWSTFPRPSSDTDSLYFIFIFWGPLPWFAGFWAPRWWPAYFLGIFMTHRLLGGPFHDPQHFRAPFMIHNISDSLLWFTTFLGPCYDSLHFRAPFLTQNTSGAFSWFTTFPGPCYDSLHFRAPFLIQNISGAFSWFTTFPGPFS